MGVGVLHSYRGLLGCYMGLIGRYRGILGWYRDQLSLVKGLPPFYSAQIEHFFLTKKASGLPKITKNSDFNFVLIKGAGG